MPDALFVQQPSVTYSGPEFRRLVAAVHRTSDGDPVGGGVLEGLRVSATGTTWSVAPGQALVSDNAGGYYVCYFDTTITGPIPAVPSGSRTDTMYVQVNDPGDGQGVIGRGNGVSTVTPGQLQMPLGTLITTPTGTTVTTDGRRYAQRVGHGGARLFTSATRDSTYGALGEVGLETDTWLRWIHDGGGWSVSPGQLLAHQEFGDNQYYDYSGLYRIGQRGGVDANVFFTRPRVLPFRGIKVTYRVTPAISGASPGDLLRTTLYNYTGPIGQIGAGLQNIQHNNYGPAYQASMIDSQVFLASDPALGPVNTVTNLAVAAVMPTGLVAFSYGRIDIEAV